MTMTTTTTATPTPPQEGQAAAQWAHPPPTLHLGATQWDPSRRPVQDPRQVLTLSCRVQTPGLLLGLCSDGIPSLCFLLSPRFSLFPTLGYYSALGFPLFPSLAIIQPLLFYFYPPLAKILSFF